MTNFAAESLLDVLAFRAGKTPDRRAYRFLSDDGQSEQTLTYGELLTRAQSIGTALRQHAAPGARVLLVCPPGLEFITAFFGCQTAEMIAVPVSAPHPRRLDRDWPRIESILRDCAASIVVTSSELRLRLADACRGRFPSIKIVSGDDGCEPASGVDELRELSRDKLAFLQYTSGSTGSPRGVMVSHGNLLANLELIRQALETSEESVAVFWLPFHHDMGLIGGILEPLYCGCEATFISPLAFIHRPLRWLHLISDLKATISGGPNFAYDECVRRISPALRSSLDLSSWKVAFCGAEPIHAETLQRFAESFAGCGFRSTSFLPCYGLAEATLLVSGAGGRPLVTHRRSADEPVRVACGAPAGGQRVWIVSPETRQRCANGDVGEIWVSGDSVAQGYWSLPDINQEIFQGMTSEGAGPFLRTGDLGYFHDGELYITGRLKDLIIINGRNHYPQDIERTVSGCHPLIRENACAAFSIERNSQEQLTIVAEVDPRLWTRETASDDAHACRFADDALAVVRRAVTDQHEVQPAQIVLVPAGEIPRTTSGKMRRRECRALFLDGKLKDVRGEWMVREAQAEG